MRIWVAIVTLVLGLTGAATAADVYVATNGNDAWSGALAEPNAAKTDGPFATLDRARGEIRKMKNAGPLPAGGVTVWVRGGLYEMAETLTFEPEDSGTEAAPIVYRAYKDEAPVISGGRRVSEWMVDQWRWSVVLPEVAKGEWDFAQLFVNGERRYRPRLPREGYYYIAGPAPCTAPVKPNKFDRFRYGGDDIRATWSNVQDMEFHAFHAWSTSRLRLASVDEKTHTVTLTGPTFRKLGRGTRYLVENVKEALERPGEWYLDRKLGT